MTTTQDTLDRTAHSFGITDVEFAEQELILKVLASLPEPQPEPQPLMDDEGFPFGDECFEEELSQITEENEGAFITAQMNKMVI